MQRSIVITLLAFVCASTFSAPVLAEDEDVTCTLKKALKVRVNGTFEVVEAGENILVKRREAAWSTVVVKRGQGLTATKLLERFCAPLPPRPPLEDADVEATPKPTPTPVVKATPKPTPKPVVKATPKPVVKATPKPKPKPKPDTTPTPTLALPAGPVLGPPMTPAFAPGPLAPGAMPDRSEVEAVVQVAPAPPTVTAPEPTPVSTTPRILRVAVQEFQVAEDDGSRMQRVITDAVVAELRKLEGISVIGMDEIRALLDLEAQKQLVGCGDQSCLAEIAEALGADVLVAGTLADVGDGRVFGLKRLDARRAEGAGQVNQRLDDSDEAVLAMVGPAVEALFADKALRVGESRGVSPELHLRLRPPPVPVWATATVGGIAGASLLVAGGAAIINGVTYADAVSLAKASSVKNPIDGGDLAAREATLQTTYIVAVSTVVAGGVIAAGAGVMALFTDWQGYGDEGE